MCSYLCFRYGIEIKLTVTRVDTGGTAVEYYRATSTANDKLTLNAPIYIGGLPAGVTVSDCTI